MSRNRAKLDQNMFSREDERSCFKDPVQFFKNNIQSVKQFKWLVGVVIGEEPNLCEKWQNKYNRSISDSFLEMTRHVASDFPVSEKSAKFSISDILTEEMELPHDVILVNENANVISSIAKKYCMIHHKSSVSIWNDVAYCWSLEPSDGDRLFFYSLTILLQNSTDQELADLLSKTFDHIDLILLAYLCDSVDCNLYKYQCLSPADCIETFKGFKKDDFEKRMQEIDDGTVKSIIQPGSSFLFKYTVEGKEHESHFMIGTYATRMFPFVSHSNLSLDISGMVVFNIKVEHGRDSYGLTNLANQKKMSSPVIIKTLLNPMASFQKDVDYQLCNFSSRNLRLPSAVPVTFKSMNASVLTSKHIDRVQEFGAAVFRAIDFDNYRPKTLQPDDTVRMDFKELLVSKIQRGVYQVLQSSTSFSLSAESARLAGIKLLNEMGPWGKLSDFIRETKKAFPNGWNGKQIKDDSIYLYAHGKSCPFISDWSEMEKILLSINTSSLQDALKYDAIEGITNHHYYISLANSIFVVHVEDRGLNAANFLLVGAKFWVVIPKKHFTRFMLWLQKKLGSCDFAQCRNWFMHKMIYLDPLIIPQEFELTFLIQRAGDLVLLDNLAVHWGWNVEFNVALSFNYSHNPNWDTVQHILPVCQFEDDINCAVPGLNTEQLMVMRMHDTLLQSSQIPTKHITDPFYNHHTCGWSNPFPEAATMQMEAELVSVDLDDDTPVSPPNSPAPPSATKSTQASNASLSQANQILTTESNPKARTLKRIIVKLHNPVQCPFCPSRLKDTSGLRSHIATYHKDAEKFSIGKYGRKQEKQFAKQKAALKKIANSNNLCEEGTTQTTQRRLTPRVTQHLETTDDSSDESDDQCAKYIKASTSRVRKPIRKKKLKSK